MTKFRKTVENIWYHYKAHILFGLFLIGAILFCLYSCTTRQTYDLQVYYVCDGSPYTEQLLWIENAVTAHCKDYNGDGEIRVAVTGINVGANTSPNERADWMNAVNAGEVLLFFGDEAGITYLYQNGYLQTLNDFSSDLWAEDRAWKVTGSAFASQTPGFEIFDGTVVYAALRVRDGAWSSFRGSVQKNFDAAEETLRSLINYLPQE